MGDIQVNLVDKAHRERMSHEITVAVRADVTRIAREAGGNAKQSCCGRPVSRMRSPAAEADAASSRRRSARQARRVEECTSFTRTAGYNRRVIQSILSRR